MNIERLLADYVIGLPYEKIPPSVVEATKAHGIYVRGAISCAVGCPYEG